MGGMIYALAGGKGGVGRTTTAINTGIALEEAGYNMSQDDEIDEVEIDDGEDVLDALFTPTSRTGGLFYRRRVGASNHPVRNAENGFATR